VTLHANVYCFQFQITLHGLETRTLWLTVWHSDMFGRNDFLGEVMMALENKVFDDPSPHWYPLQERVREQTIAVLMPSLYIYVLCIKPLDLMI